ncbi:hypothetical protein PG999_008892 [Apiospora kogelbergensis]|uniref:Short chain dehydrogenase n=1 Tax=Apiospora kogelbergensis TaxID=1337665 RepID=A0AAW0QSL8_9PEZI
MAPTDVLITGPNRGLGKGLAQRFFAKPDHVVVAANRDPEGLTSMVLHDLLKGEDSRLILVKLDSSIEYSPSEAVKVLIEQGIKSLDTVVANAGISVVYPIVSDHIRGEGARYTDTSRPTFWVLYGCTRLCPHCCESPPSRNG